MGFFQKSIENRLSAMLGMEVRFEKVSFSLLGGSIDVHGVMIGGNESAIPLVTIRRVRAEFALAAALKKEFVIKSLTLERPIVSLARSAPERSSQQWKESADMSASPSDIDAKQVEEGTWKFAARKVLIVDGEVHYRKSSGYHASVEQIVGEVKESGNGLELTLMADSAGRRDQMEAVGQIRIHGHADDMTDLSRWRTTRARGTVEVGEMLRAQVDMSSAEPLDVKCQFAATFNSTVLARLLPSDIREIDVLRTGKLRGRIELNGHATYRLSEGLRVPDLTVHATDVIFSTAKES